MRWIIELVCPPIASVGLLLFGQAHDPQVLQGWLPQVGAVSVLAWYVYYNATKTLPNMQKAHNQALGAVIESHKEDRELFRRSLHDVKDTVQGAYGRGYIDGMQRTKDA